MAAKINKATNQGGYGYDPYNPHPFDTQYPDLADNLPIPLEQQENLGDCESPLPSDTNQTTAGN